MQRAIDVFFYGLFMDRNALLAQGLKPGPARRARVDGYRLHIGERATLMPDPGGVVWGVVMAMPFDVIECLYAASSVVEYRPEAVLAKLEDGTLVATLCYNLPDGAARGANPAYAQSLCALAERLSLPADYRSYLRTIAK